ncbi:hypothetical protein TrRE_jg5027, partial [Triparma retinervis]
SPATFYEGMTHGVTDEDEAMQLALAMSMAGGGEEEFEGQLMETAEEGGEEEDEKVRKALEDAKKK